MMRKSRIITEESIKKWRKDPFLRILEDWYGKEAASIEIHHHLPETVNISNVIDNVMKEASGKENAILSEIKDKWLTLVGRDVAEVTTPLKIRNSVLYVQVSNSSWIMELKSYRKIILEKISSALEKNSVNDIIFTHAG